MKPRVYQKAYPVIMGIRKENEHITSTGIVRALQELGFKKEEIPSINTIQSYCRTAGVQLSLSLGPHMKRTATDLYAKGEAIASIEKQVNEMYSTTISNMTIRRWVLGENYGRRPKRIKKKSVEQRCTEAIVNRDIDESESIDWLIENGVSEDSAFEWAMQRFYGGSQIVTKTSSCLRAVEKPSPPSKIRRAA